MGREINCWRSINSFLLQMGVGRVPLHPLQPLSPRKQVDEQPVEGYIRAHISTSASNGRMAWPMWVLPDQWCKIFWWKRRSLFFSIEIICVLYWQPILENVFKECVTDTQTHDNCKYQTKVVMLMQVTSKSMMWMVLMRAMMMMMMMRMRMMMMRMTGVWVNVTVIIGIPY